MGRSLHRRVRPARSQALCAVVPGLLAAILSASASSPARAGGTDEARPTGALANRRPRILGFGVGTTGGWFQGRTRTLEWNAPTFGLLDLNAIAHINPFLDLQLWLPVSWMIWETKADGPFFNAALIARVHPVRTSGFYLGPGIDLHAFRPDSFANTNWAVTFPIALGYETGYPDDSFGFTIALRPEVGVLVDGNVSGNTSVTTRGLS